jgi:hypothetical protein
MHKLDTLTTFGCSNDKNYIYLYIKDLTSSMHGQYKPTEGGQGDWLFQFSYRNGPYKNKHQLFKDNFFWLLVWEKKKSGSAGSCLKQVKIYLLIKVIRQTAVSGNIIEL